MKWAVVLFALLALLCSVLAESDQDAESRSADYTGSYAELAAPVPSHVNEQEVVATLLRTASQ